MKIIIGIIIVVLISLIGSRKLFTKVKIPLTSHFFYLTGTEYILVGICLGDYFLSILDQPTLSGLNPLLYLSLGWIGLIFGVQLDFVQISRFPKKYFYLSMFQATLTLMTISLPFIFIIDLLFASSSSEMLLCAFTLGSIAAPTGQSSLALILKEHKLRDNRLADFMTFVAGVDAVIALFGIGILYCYGNSVFSPDLNILVVLSYFFTSLILGLSMGWLLHILTRIRCAQDELVLYTIGVIVFGAGASFYLRISPLFVSLISGFVIANVQGAKARVSRVLSLFERPFYIILLIIGGSLIKFHIYHHFMLVFILLYILLRVFGKYIGGYLSSLFLKNTINIPSITGLGLISQSGIAAAMVVSFHHTFKGYIFDAILMLVLFSIIINELLSSILTRTVISKAD